MMSRKAPIAILALALAIAPTLAQDGWPTSGCAGDGPTETEYTVGAYNGEATVSQMVNTLFEGPLSEGLVTVDSQSLYGASSQSGIVEYCQGFIYEGLLGTPAADPTAVVFTTGNGEIPHLTPIPGSSPFGNADDNYASNDRYTVVANTPNITSLPGTSFDPVCFNSETGSPANEFEGSGMSATFTAQKTGAITFDFAFASDEYPEYVTRQYKDQMRFLYRVNGGPYMNVALVGGDNVGIDTVNKATNSGQYIDNDSDNINAAGFTAYPTQYDGITTFILTEPMSFKTGDVVDVAIFVVDCNDRNLDSAIIIQPGRAIINDPPLCFPEGAGVTIVPSPSGVGNEISITFDVFDTDLASGVCTTPSGAQLVCDGFVPIDGTSASRCSLTYTTTPADYVDGGVVSCVATDTGDQTVTCAAELLLNAPPSCYPEGQGVTIDPNPSVPGAVDITFSVADDDLVDMTCTAPSGGSVSCTTFVPVDGSNPAAVQCTLPYTTTEADYVDGGVVSCVATDSAGQTVSCSAALLLLVPSPVLPSPAVPSPKPAPSPAKPVPLPSPIPEPSPAKPEPLPSPAPPPGCVDPVVPEPEIPDGADPNNAQCWILSGSTTIDYSANKTCSNCQWQCLTNAACTGIAIYTSDNVVSREDLATWNCGNGAWNNGAMLCVLVGQEGQLVYPDTQEQGCNECRHQCQFWSDCTGVYYQYTYYDKVGLYQTMCC